MEFNAANKIVQLCLQGMGSEEQDEHHKAADLFRRALAEATTDFEKFLATFFVARHQSSATESITYYKQALHLAEKIKNEAVQPAFTLLHQKIAACYALLNSEKDVQYHQKMALSAVTAPADEGPFFHGTRANLDTGDTLTPNFTSNYQENLMMNHVYFTASPSIAALAAGLAKGDGHERIYIVKPEGSFEHDPNVTNVKFPGNPTRSYRTIFSLKIIGELKDIQSPPSAEEIKRWQQKLADGKGGIIN